LLLTEDREVWSVCTFGALLSQIPANIYFLYRVYMLSGNVDHRIQWVVSCCYVFGELVIILVIFHSLAHITESMHGAQKCLPVVQMRLPRASMRLKLKLLSLYERLDLRNNRFKFGYSIGPLCTITNESFTKV